MNTFFIFVKSLHYETSYSNILFSPLVCQQADGAAPWNASRGLFLCFHGNCPPSFLSEPQVLFIAHSLDVAGIFCIFQVFYD